MKTPERVHLCLEDAKVGDDAERFSKCGANGGWESFSRMLESSAGKELGKEALETIREIFKPAKKDDYPDDGDEETFDEYKALPPAPDPGPGKPGKDYTPLKILVRFIENNGDPSAYLETMRVSYPDHPFCQTLITCESAEQLLEKLGTFPFSSYFSDTDFRKNRCKSVLIRV